MIKLMRSTLVAICLFSLAGIASAVNAPPTCVFPPQPAGDGQPFSNWVIVVIVADIFNLSDEGPKENAYATRLAKNTKAILNLDCTTQPGIPWLGILRVALVDTFKREPDWNKSLERIELFRQKAKYPEMAIIFEAEYWIQYAWNARGSGYAASVTPDGWKLFRERMERAEKLLLDNKESGSTIPVWYEQMIIVATALDRPVAERDKIFYEGATRYKKNYYLYKTMRDYLDPKWGGSFEAVDNLIQWSAINTKDIGGDMIYANLYIGYRKGLKSEQNFFKDTKASWPRLKKALGEMMKAYPNEKVILNNFASVACEAGDKGTYLSLRKNIQQEVIKAAWTDKYSIELCDTKYGYGQ